MIYRVTLHTETKFAPVDAMFKRKFRYAVPELNDKIDIEIDANIEFNEILNKEKKKI